MLPFDGEPHGITHLPKSHRHGERLARREDRKTSELALLPFDHGPTIAGFWHVAGLTRRLFRGQPVVALGPDGSQRGQLRTIGEIDRPVSSVPTAVLLALLRVYSN